MGAEDACGASRRPHVSATECTAGEAPVALWKSLPADVHLQIVALLPSLEDAARLGRVSRDCYELVEKAMRGRYAAMRSRITGEDIFEMEELALPDGMRSWAGLLASRCGLLPPDRSLLLLPTEGTETESLDCGGGFVVSSEGGADDLESFDDLDIQESLLRGIHEYGFERPSTLQRSALRHFVTMRDVLVHGSSGIGKTATYVIGVLQNIDPHAPHCQAVVLVPTRELAVAVDGAFFKGLGAHLSIRTIAFGGLTSYRSIIRSLRNGGIQVVIGTPGRVCDLVRRRALVLRQVHQLVLDEADELLSHGFRDQIYNVFQALPLTAHVDVISATFADDVLQLASNLLPRDPVRVRLFRSDLTLYGVRQFYLAIEHEAEKLDALCDLMDILLCCTQVIVYVSTCRKAAWLNETMRNRDVNCSVISGHVNGRETCDQVLRDFRSGDSRMLITEDSAVRLLRHSDIQNAVSWVIYFDLPANRENYLLLVGREGRFVGAHVAVTFVTAGDMRGLRDIEQFYSVSIEEMPMDIVDLI